MPSRITPIIALSTLLFSSMAACKAQTTQQSRPPNIVFILADDLGYGDVGCYGQKKIHTPNIDQMAAEGMRFTRHYAGNAVCAPSRCVLMTGMHPGHAEIRDNREADGGAEGQYPLSAGAVTVASLLKQHGYVTGAFGKWGLGTPASTGDPLNKGFDRFYGYNCQRQAHNYYPTYLWDNDKKAPLNNPAFSAYQKLPANLDPNDASIYTRYAGSQYAPDLICEQARQFIRANAAHPFFLYLPTTVPHVALQVPEDSLAEYLGKLDDTPYKGEQSYLPHRAPHAAYAAMITRMDREIGSIVALVKQLGLDNNTLFVFTSDNGPVYERVGGSDAVYFNSAGPLNGFKGSLYEGGVRMPMIARWPGKIAPGSQSDRITGFEDWLPTLVELSSGRGAVPKKVDGVSFLPTLLGKKQPERPFLYREFADYGGQQALWTGEWKAIRQKLLPTKQNPNPAVRTELYNLKTDVAESTDVAAEHPDIVARLESLMARQHLPSKEFPIPVLDAKR